MTWSYVPPAGDPPVFAKVKDHVRFLLGDRVQSWWSPADEEVESSRAAWNVTYPSDQDNPEGIASVMAVAIAVGIAIAMAIARALAMAMAMALARAVALAMAMAMAMAMALAMALDLAIAMALAMK